MKAMAYFGTWEVIWVDQQEKLQSALSVIAAEDELSVDTETFDYQSGNEKLGLVQVGAVKAEKAYLIDPLAFSDWVELLRPQLESPDIGIIAHNASFEERQFARHGIKMRGAIDTLKMARKLRADLPNHTLKTCCSLILNIDISKEQQVSDWEKRPLSEEQINYAAYDVEVTYQLYQVLLEMQNSLELDSDSKVPELMQQLYENERQTFQLLSGISAELELLKLKNKMLKEAIRNKLISGEPEYQGEYGNAGIQKVRRNEINPVKVREKMPDIADLVIKETVQQKDLKQLIEEYGYDKKLLNDVTEFLRYDDRLKLTLADF